MEENVSEIEFEHSLEEEIEGLDIEENRRKIYTDQGDPEIESLYNKYKRGRLIIQPDFQRQFVWDRKKSSRLIESALLDIPLPVIYLSQDNDGKEYVIDGQQRLTSFFSYIDDKFPDSNDFKLIGLQVFSEYNKKKFKELPENIQDKIRYCMVRTITFKNESDPNLKFEVFERLNTGSVSLNDQELRNCMYRGRFNDLLKELSSNTDFMDLLNIDKPDKRMKDVELVLRFSSFYLRTYLNYKSPMRGFLNGVMDEYQNISDEKASELKEAFKNTIHIIKSLFGNHAFKRFYKGNQNNPNGNWESKKFNASLYDVLTNSFAKENKNVVFANLDSIREAFIDLMTTNQEFIDSIELSTSSVQAVTQRFDKWRLRLQEIIGIQHREPRCFTFSLKEELFNKDSTCAICGNKIQTIDDSAVDHIEQYWQGGKTIPENARLTHRYCNSARSRTDS